MDKLAFLVIFAAFIGLSCSFPSKEQDSMEWMETARNTDSEDAERVTRNQLLCPELGLLRHYDVDLPMSHINCKPVTRKRAMNLVNEFKRRELENELSDTARRELACCSPDCDWLLDYLEIDSTVVKCLDRK